MAVNLLPPDAKELAQRSVLHRSVYFFTTLGLVIYLVAVSAVGGWWLFLPTRQSQLQAQITDLSGQVAQKAPQEVLLRQESTRVAQIDTKFKNRINLVELADKLIPAQSGLTVTGWNFVETTNKNTLSLSGASSGSIEGYSLKLLDNFNKVNIDSLSRAGGVWQGEISVGNVKKP